MVFREKCDAGKTVRVVNMHVTEFLKSRVKSGKESVGVNGEKIRRKKVWEAPKEGMAKINIDGAFIGEGMGAGVRVVEMRRKIDVG